MNESAQKEFDRIIKLDPEALTPEEAGFLAARRDYLNQRELKVFKNVIDAAIEENLRVANEGRVQEEQPSK